MRLIDPRQIHLAVGEQLDQRHASVLLALYDLDREGQCPCNEEDLAAQLGYNSLDEFERDAGSIEHAVREFRRLGWIETDERDDMSLTPAGREVADRLAREVRHHQTETESAETPAGELLPVPGQVRVRVLATGGQVGMGRPLAFSGVVEAVAADVRAVTVGDSVYGLVVIEADGEPAVEQLTIDATRLAPKPQSLDHGPAAGIPAAALTAWQALFDLADLGPGQTVLIEGASSEVGAFAVQLARWTGAHVIATAPAADFELMQRLGADQVIDEEAELPAQRVDVVFDATGMTPPERAASVLRRGGTYVSTGPVSTEALRARGVVARELTVVSECTELGRIAELIDAGQIRFPLQ